MRRASIIFTTALFALGCSGSGLGEATRKDITDRMMTAQQPIATCYRQALTRNRQLRGQMMLKFTAAAKTGKFTQVTVASNQLADTELEQCVIGQVSTLALQTPTKSDVAVTYPLEFAPTN